VDAFVEGRKKIGEKKLGNTKAIILYEEQTDDLIHEAHKRGLDIGNIPLQDLFVYLTQEVS
jgi:ABC-2 type transport system ATP-binding protein